MLDKASLTKENVKYIIDAFSHFFPEGTIYSSDKPYTSGEFNWNNRESFIDFIFRLTGVKISSDKDIEHIKKAQLAVIKLAEGETQKVEANIPGEETREAQEKERAAREESIKKAREESREAVQTAIKKQQEIQAALANKKVYVKVEVPKTPEPSVPVKNFINEAKSHPQSFTKELTENIKSKIAPKYSDILTKEEIDLLATKTAADTIRAINSPQSQTNTNTQTAILGSLSKDGTVIQKVVGSTDNSRFIQNAASEIAFFKNTTNLSRNIISFVNKDLAEAAFGPSPSEIKITLSDQPMEGYTHEVNLDSLSSGYADLLQNQSRVFDNISSFAGGEAKRFLLGQARTFVDSQITNLPADSAISGLYNSAFGQQVLSYVGFVKYTPFNDSFMGVLVQNVPGASTFFEGLGNTLGIDFGITTAAPTVEAAEATMAVTEGATLVEAATVATGVETGVAVTVGGAAVGAETGAVVGAEVGATTGAVVGAEAGTATGAGIGAALGISGGPLALITAAVGAAVGWLASKIPWKKIGPWILGALIGGVVWAMAGPVVGVTAAVGTYLITSGITVGTSATLATISSGFGRFLSYFAITIGTPILITLLAFPVVVALILFIINSGAYVVPPTTSTINSIYSGTQSPYIDVQKTISPSGPFQNSQLPLTIEYTVQITAKKGTLTNISIDDKCQVIKNGSSPNCPDPDKKIGSDIPIPDIISPSSPFIFKYKRVYNSSDFKDSLTTDTVTVTADETEQAGAKASGSASVIIGSPPTSCFVFDNSWNASDKARETLAITKITRATTYVSTLCKAGPIILHRVGNGGGCGGGGGEVTGSTINIYDAGVNCNDFVTYYTLAHETGHIYSMRTNKYQLFLDSGAMSEGMICTYPNALQPSEDFAEMIALYYTKVAGSTKASCMSGTLQTAYPLHWSFARNNIFMENLDW